MNDLLGGDRLQIRHYDVILLDNKSTKSVWPDGVFNVYGPVVTCHLDFAVSAREGICFEKPIGLKSIVEAQGLGNGLFGWWYTFRIMPSRFQARKTDDLGDRRIRVHGGVNASRCHSEGLVRIWFSSSIVIIR